MSHPNRSKKNPSEFHRVTPAEIVRAREAAGHSQAQAAALIGVTLSAWQRWEQAERDMHPAHFQLYRRKVVEREAIEQGLGFPDVEVKDYVASTGAMLFQGFGWLLAKTEKAEIVLGPYGELRVSYGDGGGIYSMRQTLLANMTERIGAKAALEAVELAGKKWRALRS